MKITKEIQGLNPATLQNSPGVRKDGSFSEVLALAVDKEQKNTAKSSQTQMAGNQLGGNLPPEWFQINGLLDSLDQFGQALADNNKSLREIEPLVVEMEEKAQKLDEQLDAETQSPLHPLAKEALARAQTEALKFRRGDYV
jgi:hypothetical protein